MIQQFHKPVMVAEILEIFDSTSDGFFLDATLGDGGHAEAILSSHKNMKLVGLDRDAAAIKRARQRLARLADRCIFANARFDHLEKELDKQGISEIAGAIFDLGVSSEQLENPDRGFSFRVEGPLDMRMDQNSSFSAEEIVNEWSANDLADVLYEYGDERQSRRIAAAIIKERPISNTSQLAKVVAGATRNHGSNSHASKKKKRKHPARRTFQALRIKVNGELECIEPALKAVSRRLMPKGRGVVIAYHSGEDRIVKKYLREVSSTDEKGGDLKLLNRKVKKPTPQEIEDNPRAKSARLRSFEKLGVN